MCRDRCVCVCVLHVYVGLSYVLVKLSHADVTRSFDGLCWMQIEQLDRIVSVVADSLVSGGPGGV